MKSNFLGLIILFFLTLAFAWKAEATVLLITPPNSQTALGEKIIIDVKIDSEGASFNAAQAVLRFPKDTLKVASLEKTTSVFSFWLEEPTFSNDDGVISFTGGTPYGTSGSSVQVLKIEFLSKSSGSGVINISDAAITASDGSGANILSKTVDGSFRVSPQRGVTAIPEPQPIVREPIPTGKLPQKPILNVSLYPNDSSWYNIVNSFNVSWDLPLDVVNASTAINKQPNYNPTKSEGLFDGKTFAALPDGVSYLHVRFGNNIGWGETAHYRLAIDTQPPLGFAADILEGETTDNPTPTIQFNTSDALSGLKEYQIRIGDGDLIHIIPTDFAGSFKLPLQGPGKQKVLVKAVDQADNSIENSLDIEILPIASPVITFTPRELFSEDEQGLVVKGTALPDISVLLKIQKVLREGRGEIVGNGTAHSDDKGNWEFTFGEQPLRNGRYVVLAQSQDARGALSLIVESALIKVKSKPIIQIGPIQLGKGGAALVLLFLLVIGFAGGIWFYKKRQEKLALRVWLAKSEVTKMFKLIMEDVDRLSKAYQTPTSGDDEYAMKRLQEDIKKMESYLQKGLEKIKK